MELMGCACDVVPKPPCSFCESHSKCHCCNEQVANEDVQETSDGLICSEFRVEMKRIADEERGPRCECGVGVLGFGKHSDWCQLYRKAE